MSDQPVEVPESDRRPAAATREIGTVGPEERVEVTLVLRRRANIDDAVVASGTLTVEELGRRFGASPEDVDTVITTIVKAGASVVEVDAPSRRVRIEGSSAVLPPLFGTHLARAECLDPTTGLPVLHRQRTGALTVPAVLDGILTAVL